MASTMQPGKRRGDPAVVLEVIERRNENYPFWSHAGMMRTNSAVCPEPLLHFTERAK